MVGRSCLTNSVSSLSRSTVAIACRSCKPVAANVRCSVGLAGFSRLAPVENGVEARRTAPMALRSPLLGLHHRCTVSTLSDCSSCVRCGAPSPPSAAGARAPSPITLFEMLGHANTMTAQLRSSARSSNGDFWLSAPFHPRLVQIFSIADGEMMYMTLDQRQVALEACDATKRSQLFTYD